MVSQKTLRVKFEKTGKLQYISHLDLLRTMQSAIRRAGIKMIYSEGFNPHMKVSFALPLSIGTESTCEFMDIKVTEETDKIAVKRNLGKNLPRDMKILEVYEPETKFTDIKYASYTIYLDYGDKSEAATEKAKELFSKELVVIKKTKSGEKPIDIHPWILKSECRYSFGVTVIDCVLCADSASYLNPAYLIGALNEEMNTEPDNKKILRNATFTSDEKLFR